MLIERAHPVDTPGIVGLLQQTGLPQAGLLDHLGTALVARDGEHIVGCAALELYPPIALLRSVAVDPAWRGRGVGQQLTQAALRLAQHHGVTEVYLLTETAATFFSRVGFQPINRSAVHPAVHQSVEWTSACPASALVMHTTWL